MRQLPRSVSAPAVGPARARARAGQADLPLPNAWRHGTVTRTMWPPAAGTLRLHREHGERLLCVRHREDPAGLRRIVTVELIVGPVGPRPQQRRLKDRVRYPVQVDRGEHALRERLRAHDARWSPVDQLWYVTGSAIRLLGLADRIAFDRRANAKGRAGR